MLYVYFSVNLEVKEGSLIAVVGQVGSGKSSLLSAMLGDMVKLSGDVTLKVNISVKNVDIWWVIEILTAQSMVTSHLR